MLRPIDTEYGGRLYRSRLEARWAVFFDAAWIRFDYEPEGFMLPSGPYLPDFFLRLFDPVHPGSGYWVEIKPRGLASDRAHTRLSELCRETGHNGFLVAGDPWPGEFELWKYLRRYGEGRDGGRIYHVDASETTGPIPIDPVWLQCTDVPWDPDETTIWRAFHAARSARFEHSQAGGHGFARAGDVLDELRKGPRLGRAVRRGETIDAAVERMEGTEPA